MTDSRRGADAPRWSCPNCSAVFGDEQAMKDHATTTCFLITPALPTWVSPLAIVDQRERGWPDFHPETYCHRCGGKNVRSWFVESDRFNAAVVALGLNTNAIVCPGCFVLGHELATGLGCTWRLVPDTHFRPMEDVTDARR